MPLRDHFHAPWDNEFAWEEFHSVWTNTMVRQLNLCSLPPGFRAVPNVRVQASVEADVVTFARDHVAVAQEQAASGWSPPAPALTFEFPVSDEKSYDESYRDLRVE